MINVLGDALAAGIMAHLCKEDFDKTSNGAARNTPPAANDHRVRTAVIYSHQPVLALHVLPFYRIKTVE